MSKEKFKRKIRRAAAAIAALALAVSITIPAGTDMSGIGFGNAIVASAAPVASGTCGDYLTWTLDDNDTLTISYTGSGSGAMDDWDNPNDVPWNSSQESIKSVVIEQGVTSIGDYAFCECSNIESISIEDSVNSIGEGAFARCISLTSVTIPDSVNSIGKYAFQECSNLTSVLFKNNPQFISIGFAAFIYCSSLKSITIPYGIHTIEAYAFDCCSNFRSIFLPERFISIGTDAIPYEATRVKYTVSGNTVTITEVIPSYNQTSVDIPEKIGGYPVVSVATDYQNYVGNHTHYFSNNICGLCSGAEYVTGITVSPDTLSVTVGDPASQLTATVVPTNALDTSVEWTSSDTAVATVDDSGNVTAVGRGTATITATAKDGSGIYGECAVTVNARSYNISISAEIRNGRIMADSTAKAGDTVTIEVSPDQCYKLKTLTVENGLIMCTNTGVNKYTFTMPERNVTISAEFKPSHTLSKVERAEPTCTTEGNTEYYKCSRCGKLFSDENGINETTLAAVTIPVDNTAHRWSTEWEYDKDYHWHKCLNTGCTEINGKAEHSSNAAATETTAEVCKDCGYVMAPALGHIHANHLTFVAEVPETCTTDGVKAHYECDCGKLFEDAAAATETTLSQLKIPAHHSYGTEWVSDNDSNHYHVCSVCGDKTDITAHSYDSGVITTEPTEQTTGIKTYTCSECTHTKTEIVPKLDHTHSLATEYSSDATGHWYACSGCTEKVDFETHTEDSGTVTTEPTETTEGVKTFKCVKCEYVMRTETIPPITPEHTHEYGTEWIYDSTSHWHECSCGEKTDVSAHISDDGVVKVQPTAASTGIKVYSCKVCGYYLRKETIPAKGYDYDLPNSPADTFDSAFFTGSVFTEALNVNAETKGNTVTLSWKKINIADKYYVYQYKDGKYVRIKNTADNSVTFRNLKNGKTYQLLVKYTINGRLSPIRYAGKVTVKAYYKPIAKATATENSVRLTWKEVPGAEKYAVYKYVDGKAVKLTETKKLSVKIGKLIPDTEYKYTVRAYVDGKWTKMLKSDIVTVKTNAE